jgi:hypothetical protein
LSSHPDQLCCPQGPFPIGTGASFLGIRRPETENNQLSLSSADVNNNWSLSPLPFISWCSGRRGTLLVVITVKPPYNGISVKLSVAFQTGFRLTQLLPEFRKSYSEAVTLEV